MGVVDRMSAALGAEVDGLDLRCPSERLRDDLYALLDEHLVVAVRGQRLSEDEHLALTRLLGEPWIHPISRLQGQVTVEPVTVEARSDDPLGTDRWHVDFPYLPAPPSVGILSALDMPAYGGDTMWLNLRLAHDRLADGLRERLTDRQVIHSVPESFIDRRAGDDPMQRAMWTRVCVENRHPAVRTHPRTGEQSIYVLDPNAEVDGLDGDQARELLAPVVEHATQLNHTCRWRWRNGDVVLYDQAATFHRLIMDPWPGVRRMRRTLVEGERPF